MTSMQACSSPLTLEAAQQLMRNRSFGGTGCSADTMLAVDRRCSLHRRPINSPWEGSAHPQQPVAGSDLC